MSTEAWYFHRAFLLEVFALCNIAFLALDIYIAHSVNAFAHPAEWIPVAFSLGATVLMILAFPLNRRHLAAGWRRTTGLVVGGFAVLVGVSGMLFHLQSQFFALQSIKSLVYTAPFVAPLAYAGVGLLIIMNRMVDPESRDWGEWVVFFALTGVLGNYVLAVCDHAQNGFFYAREWIPVFVTAFTIGFLTRALMPRLDRSFLRLSIAVIVLQGAAGLLGFYYHVIANAQGPAQSLRDNFLYGAPAFAPLLLPNISLLAALGLASLGKDLRSGDGSVQRLLSGHERPQKGPWQ